MSLTDVLGSITADAHELVERTCPGCLTKWSTRRGVGFPICAECDATHGNITVDERIKIMRGGMTLAQVLQLRTSGRPLDDGRVHVPRKFHDAEPDEARMKWACSDAATLLITGPVGVGKTYQAVGALRAVLRAATINTHGYMIGCAGIGRARHEDLRVYSSTHILVMDDLGARIQPSSLGAALEILDNRLSDNLRTIVTSNMLPTDIMDLDPRLGSRLLSGTPQVMAGADRRLA